MIKKLKYLVVPVFLFIGFFHKAWSQELDVPIFRHNDFFSSKNTDLKDLLLLDSLYNHWYCIENKELYISSISKNIKEEKQLEFLTLLQALNKIQQLKKDEAFYYLSKIKRKDEIQFLGQYYVLSAKYYSHIQNFAESIDELNNAVKYFEATDDKKALVLVYRQLLTTFSKLGDIESATNYYSKAIILCEKLNYNLGFVMIYKSYAVYIAQYDEEHAYELFTKSYELIKDNTSSPIYLKVVTDYLRFILRYKSNNEFLRVYKEVVSSFDLENTCMYAHSSIIQTFISHYYFAKNDIDSSIFFNKKALLLRKKGKSDLLVSYSYLNLANDYLALENYNYANKMLDSAANELYVNGNLKDKKEYLNFKIRLLNSSGKSEKALLTQKELYLIKDEFNREQMQQLANKYEAKNELALNLSREKYELEISKKENRNLYLFIISVLSVIIIVFLIIRLRAKRISIKKLQRGSHIDKKALHEYEKDIEQLKEIFRNAPKGFMIINRQAELIYFNNSAEEMFNKLHSLENGEKLDKFVSNEYYQIIEESLERMIEDKINKDIIIEVADIFQVKRKLNISISPLVMNNVVESFLFILTDITESQNALESEQQQRKILQTLINSVTESIVLVDSHLKITLLNKTAASRFGKSIEELIGKSYLQILPESLRQNRNARLKEVFKEKSAIVFNEEVDSYNTLVSYYPSLNNNNEIEFVAEFSQDITERKLASEQINSLRQKVLRSQMNPHFIFNSLNAIQSYVLKNESTNAVKYLNSFARLIRMILDSSRFDYITLAKEISILKYYLELQQLRFGDKFTYKLEIDDSLDNDSLLIPAMLAQPFIENAIEHGLQHLESKGTVKISFIKQQESVVFKVIDNGIGREASMKIKEHHKPQQNSLSTQLFKERLYTLNKFSGKKTTYNIIDLKDDFGVAKGTMVVINLPLIYKSDVYFN